jgi:hypothetical protein
MGMSFLARRALETAASLAVILAGDAAGMLGGQALAGDAQGRTAAVSLQRGNAIGDRALASWVEKRLQQWQMTDAERRFDEIGWAKTICDAERLAKQHGRPVFLFTYDGQMSIGRC